MSSCYKTSRKDFRKKSYRIGAVKVNKSIQKNSDIEALKNGYISVTPISINHTDTAFKNSLEN